MVSVFYRLKKLKLSGVTCPMSRNQEEVRLDHCTNGPQRRTSYIHSLLFTPTPGYVTCCVQWDIISKEVQRPCGR